MFPHAETFAPWDVQFLAALYALLRAKHAALSGRLASLHTTDRAASRGQKQNRCDTPTSALTAQTQKALLLKQLEF